MDTVSDRIISQLGSVAELDHRIKIGKEAEEILIESAREIKNLKDVDADLAAIMRKFINLRDDFQVDMASKKSINGSIKDNMGELTQGEFKWTVDDALSRASRGCGASNN
jgi:hypothetical protein